MASSKESVMISEDPSDGSWERLSVSRRTDPSDQTSRTASSSPSQLTSVIRKQGLVSKCLTEPGLDLASGRCFGLEMEDRQVTKNVRSARKCQVMPIARHMMGSSHELEDEL